jgi:hypothetical protein
MSKAREIVLACENLDAQGLVDSVSGCIVEKVLSHVEAKKQEIAGTLLGENVADINSGTWEDRYESYGPEMKKAIEEVADRVDKGEDLDECIASIVETSGVSKDKLTDFFTAVQEDSIVVDSTKETGSKHMKNKERMDDEDISKRVRFEQVTPLDIVNAIIEVRGIAFDSDEKPVSITTEQASALETTFHNLNEDNKQHLVNRLTENRKGFIEMISWCMKATK